MAWEAAETAAAEAEAAYEDARLWVRRARLGRDGSGKQSRVERIS